MALAKVCSSHNLSVLEELLLDLEKRVCLCLKLRDAMMRDSENDMVVLLFDDVLFNLEDSCHDLNLWQSCLRSETNMNPEEELEE